MEFDYLQRQKESIDKVDQLIEEAEHSLQELRREFYQTEEEIAKSSPRISKDVTPKRSSKSDRPSTSTKPPSIASKGTIEKQSIKSKQASVLPTDEAGSKRVSPRSSIKSDRTSIVEQPIGDTVDLTTSKDTGRKSIETEHSSFAQQPITSITASKGSIEKKPSRSEPSSSTHQGSMDGTTSAGTAVHSTGRRSVESKQSKQLSIATPMTIPEDIARTSALPDVTTTQPMTTTESINDSLATVSKKPLKSDPTSFAQRLIEGAANLTGSKDSSRRSAPQSISFPANTEASKDTTSNAIASKGSTKKSSLQSAPESVGFSVKVSKDTSGGKSVTSSPQQPVGVIANVNTSRESSVKESVRSSFPEKPSIKKSSSGKAPTTPEYPSIRRQQASIGSKESGGSKAVSLSRQSYQESIPTGVTTSKASTLASVQREPKSVVTSVTTSRTSGASKVTDASDRKSFNQSLQEQSTDIPPIASVSPDQTARASFLEQIIGSPTDTSTLKERSSRSMAESKVEDIQLSPRHSKTSRKSTSSQKSSRVSCMKEHKSSVPNESEKVYIDDSIKIKVYSQEATQSDEQRCSRFSILKRSIDYGEEVEPEQLIEPVPVDEKRFLNTKNSIFLKMVSATELAEDEDAQPVDAGSRIVKIAEEPSLGEFHTSGSIILQAEELNRSLRASVEREDSVSKISSASRQRKVSNIGSDIGLLTLQEQAADTTEEPTDDRKHGSECCPCDKNKKNEERGDKKITSKQSSNSSGRESRKGSVSAKSSLEPISDAVEKSPTLRKSVDSSKTSERLSKNSRESNGRSLTSREPTADEESSVKTPTETSYEIEERKSVDAASSRDNGESAETDVQEEIVSKKPDKASRKSRKRTSTKTKNEKNDALAAFDACLRGKEAERLGDERVMCDRTICRDKSCGPSKKEASPMKGSPARSLPAKSHVIPCQVPCRGEVYMQSLSPKTAREFKTKQSVKAKKKKTSGDRSRELDSARKRSDEKFDGDDEDTSVDEKASKRSTPSKTLPAAHVQTEETRLLKECCLSGNHEVCCPCTKSSTSEASISASPEAMMPAPATPEPEYHLPEPTTPDPTPTAPEPTTSATETSVDNEEGSCSCEAELEALKEFTTCDPCGNLIKLTPALKSPLSPRKPSSVCKRTAFCTECQMIPPPQPEFLSEVARIARGAGIFARQALETTSTETDTDDSHLMTISEKTEATSVAPIESKPFSLATSEESKEIASVASPEGKQLTVQHLPQINIRPALVVQKVFEIEIKSTGSVNKQIPTIDNVGFEEIVHTGASTEQLPTVILDEFIKDETDYKIVVEETSVKVIEPNISIKDTKFGFVQEKSISQTSAGENGEKKSCLKEYDYDNPILMKTVKSNVSFKQVPVILCDDSEQVVSKDGKSLLSNSKSKEKSDDKMEAETAKKKETEKEENKEENKEEENVEDKGEENVEDKEEENVEDKEEEIVEKKGDEIPKPGELTKESSGIIKDIKEGTLQHPDSTLMLVSPAHSGGNVAVKVTRSKNFADIAELNDGPSSTTEGIKECGCEKESASHISDELEVDETLNKICECYDSSLNELGSHISAETKKSLQEIHRMAAVLNKLVSDKALAESDHTDDYKLLDNHIYEAENGEENENGNEEPDKNAEKEPEHTNLELKPVYQASLENQSLPNHKFEEKLPTEEDKPNEDAVTEEEAQEPAEVNENSDGVPKESSTKTVELKPEEKSMKSVKSEKGTPLFTEDPNFRTNHKGVPKSVSQYFSSTDVSLADEDEEDGQKVKKPTRQRLSVLSDSIKKPVTSLQSTNDKNNYNAVGGVLQILQVDPTEQPRTLEECNCQCRWQQAPLAMMVASHSNPASPKNSGKILRKVLTTPKSRKTDRRSSVSSSPVNSLQPMFVNDAASLTPSIMKGKSRADPLIKNAPNPSAVARKTSFNLADRVVLPGSESYNKRPDSESEESIYVLTHDVSVQVSLDSLAPVTSSSSVARSEKKLPRVKISVQEGANDQPKSNNYSKRKHKVKSKDQYQQSQGNGAESENLEEMNGTDANQDTEKESIETNQDTEKESIETNQDTEKESIDINQDTEKESIDTNQDTEKESIDTNQDTEKECTDATPETGQDQDDLPPQTVILQPVIVHYESKGVQKSLEDWCCPPVKLHKLRRCNDLESSSTTDTDTNRSPFKNAPFGDMPTGSEFVPYSPIRRGDAQHDDDELTSLGGCRNMRMFKSSKYCHSTSSSDTVESKLEETLSEGEIKCRCSVSIGELHICRLAKDIKARAAYLKKHPEVLVKREYPGEDVRLLKKRTFYDNWVAIYASKVPPTATSSSSDTGDRSTDT